MPLSRARIQKSRQARGGPFQSSEQVVPQDVSKGRDAVAPGDLLSFLIRSSRISDWYLEDSRIRPGEPCCDLGLESESLRLERQRPGQLTPHRFIATLHVGEIEIAEHVAQRREHSVADRVPVVEHAVGSAEKAR